MLSLTSDAANETRGKVADIKNNYNTTEEFLQNTHNEDPVYVTFDEKELKV